MPSGSARGRIAPALVGGLAIAWAATTGSGALAQEGAPPLPRSSQPAPPIPFTAPAADGPNPLPINLPTALHLAHVRAVDIAAATERIRVAAAVLEQARVLWLPTITVGGDYARHDGRNQDTLGNVFDNSRSSLMFGAGTPASARRPSSPSTTPSSPRSSPASNCGPARRTSRRRPTTRWWR
jgi:hypothetical protein